MINWLKYSTLALSVGVNAYFLSTNIAVIMAIVWALAEVFAFVFPPHRWVIPVKFAVQFLSFVFTCLFLTGQFQHAGDTHDQVITSVAEYERSLANIDSQIERATHQFESTDPAYIAERDRIEDKLVNLRNTPYTYYKKPQPQAYYEATNECNPTTKKQHKIYRDYPKVCSQITASMDKLITLQNRYNSVNKQQELIASLENKRAELIEDWPKLRQNNIATLTSRLTGQFNLTGITSNLLLLLAFCVAGVIAYINLGLSLSSRKPAKSTRTDAGQLKIPPIKNVCTTPGSKYAQCLTAFNEKADRSQPINKQSVQAIHTCSNNIAQAVINTLAHNGLIIKQNKQWHWVDSGEHHQ